MNHPEDCPHENLVEETEFGDEMRTWFCSDCETRIQRGYDEPDPTEESEEEFGEEDIEGVIDLLDHPSIKGKIFEIIWQAVQYDGPVRREIESIAKCHR